MPIVFHCANCQKKYKAADASAGKTGRCTDCGHINRIPAARPTPPESSTGANQPGGKTYEVKSSINGAVFGPADQNLLRQWLKEDRITADCEIKQVGTDAWVPANGVFPEFRNSTSNDPSDVNANGNQSSNDNHNDYADDYAGQIAPVLGASSVSSTVATDVAAAANSTANPFAGIGPQGSASMSVNPYAAGSTGATGADHARVLEDITPTYADLEFIFQRAFEVYRRNWGVLVGGGLVMLLALIGAGMLAGALSALGTAAELVGGVLLIALPSFLTTGYVKMAIKASRGDPIEISDLSTAADRILPLLGYYALICLSSLIPGVAVLALLVSGAQGLMPIELASALGMLIYVVMMTAGLFLWPGLFLIIDKKTSVLKAFSVGFAIAKKNIFQFIAVYIAACVIAWIGVLGLGIGLFFTAPLGLLVVCCAYLNMAGMLKR